MDAYDASGLGRQKFCKKHGLLLSTLNRHRERKQQCLETEVPGRLIPNPTYTSEQRFPALRHANWHQLLRGFPELPVYEIGSKPAQECELLGLPGPDLLRPRLEG